jgi:flagellar protein FlaI
LKSSQPSQGFRFWRRKEGAASSAQVTKEPEVQPKAAEPEPQQEVPPAPLPQQVQQDRVLVDSYSVYDPFVRIVISLEPDGTNRYIVVEPELTKSERQQLKQLKQALKDGLSLDVSKFKPEEAEAYLQRQTRDLIKKFGLKIQKDTYAKLFYFIDRDFLHYNKLDPLMRDPNIEDISCNGPGAPIYVFHRTFESIPTNVRFKTQEDLERFILRLAYMSGRHISVAEPVVDAALPEGSRIQMTFGSEITKKGSTFTIRKFREDPYSIVDLVKFGTIDADIAAVMWYALENKGSILLSGGTASGKTTTINCLAVFIRPEAKIVTIEDTPEINLIHSNWIESVSRQGTSGMGEVTLYDLLRAALRQRPDFIVVGEVRGEEANTMFQALATGHSGMSSIHADSIQAVFNRLTNPPMSIPRNLIPSVNFILQQNRITINQKPSRRVMSVTEIVGMDARSNEIITNEAFRYDPERDGFVFTGRSYILEKYAKAKGVSVEDVRAEVATRRAVIQWMADHGVKRYSEVSKVVQRYYTDKSELLAEIGAISA